MLVILLWSRFSTFSDLWPVFVYTYAWWQLNKQQTLCYETFVVKFVRSCIPVIVCLSMVALSHIMPTLGHFMTVAMLRHTMKGTEIFGSCKTPRADGIHSFVMVITGVTTRFCCV